MKRWGLVCLAMLAFAATTAAVVFAASYPLQRRGSGNEPTAGGGIIAGKPYHTRTAFIAWSKRQNSLNLYLLWRTRVSCGTLRRVVNKPGTFIQVYMPKQARRLPLNRPVLLPTYQMVTIISQNRPAKVAGIQEGVRLTFSRINTYPGGVWHGRLVVPKKIYRDGKVYGYNGTFAARWCQLAR